jgi:hypothetical protein
MADHAKDQDKPKTDAKKKPIGTVMLTTEELRAISGGAGVNNPNPVNPNPNNNLNQ